MPEKFDAYEIHPVKEFDAPGGKFCEPVDDTDEMPHYYSLYGHYPSGGVLCIGDYKDLESAKEVYSLITGEEYF